MKDFITILPILKLAQPCTVSAEKPAAQNQDPEYFFIDLSAKSRTPPLTACGLQNIHIPERITLDVDSLGVSASSAVHSLNQAINNSEITTHLKDRNVAIENRVRKDRKSTRLNSSH